MRDLSFAAQVESLGAACRRRTFEIAERMREREALAAEEAKRRAPKPHKTTAADRIVAAMKPFTGYRWGELREASGLSQSNFSKGMASALKKKRIDKTPEAHNAVYSLPC